MSYAKLRGAIKEVFTTQEAFADAMGIGKPSLSAKLNNKAPWKREEIEKACRLLHIDIKEVHAYFFTQKVAETQQ